eukprot:COSAG06_NODE_6945_length_2704_cov_1.492131_1_plen_46_part_10
MLSRVNLAQMIESENKFLSFCIDSCVGAMCFECMAVSGVWGHWGRG